MKLTPLDIQQHQFRVRFRGFDIEEVDAFLEDIATDFEALQRKNSRLKEEINRLNSELVGYKEREDTFKRVMIESQKTIEQMKENARKSAEVTIAEAEVTAEKILNRAHTRLAQLHEDLAELKRQRTQIEIQIRSVLESHARLLDIGKEEEKSIDEEDAKLKIMQK
ncbi:MAG: DivIVA domain-containing protein [Deltaproteobacteria bacterium]|nr:DivIVA domain-containing protein [Deltaproteobacteria bacterium]